MIFQITCRDIDIVAAGISPVWNASVSEPDLILPNTVTTLPGWRTVT